MGGAAGTLLGASGLTTPRRTRSSGPRCCPGPRRCTPCHGCIPGASSPEPPRRRGTRRERLLGHEVAPVREKSRRGGAQRSPPLQGRTGRTTAARTGAAATRQAAQRAPQRSVPRLATNKGVKVCLPLVQVFFFFFMEFVCQISPRIGPVVGHDGPLPDSHRLRAQRSATDAFSRTHGDVFRRRRVGLASQQDG